METQKKESCRKKEYQKVSFDFKLFVIDKINNGQISINYASKKYGISRSSISYWMNKLGTYEQANKAMSKNYEIKKLKERIEELEFIKEFQQDVIADLEDITGEQLAKKSLPKILVKEIEKKKRGLTK